MFCIQCGTRLEEGARFCTNCGAKQLEFDNPPMMDNQPVTERPSMMDMTEDSPVMGPANPFEGTVKLDDTQEPESYATELLDFEGTVRMDDTDYEATAKLQTESRPDVEPTVQPSMQEQPAPQTVQPQPTPDVQPQSVPSAQSQPVVEPQPKPLPPNGRRYLHDRQIGVTKKAYFTSTDVGKDNFIDTLNEHLKEAELDAKAETAPVAWDQSSEICEEIVVDFAPDGKRLPASLVLGFHKGAKGTSFSQRMFANADGKPAAKKKPANLWHGEGALSIAFGLLLMLLGGSITKIVSGMNDVMSGFGGGSASGGSNIGGPLMLIFGFALLAWGAFLEYKHFQWRKEYGEWEAAAAAEERWTSQNENAVTDRIEAGFPLYEDVLICIEETCKELFDEVPE